MNEWAARIMSVFPERNKADLDEFVQQITHDKAEHMYFNKEYNAEVECRPTFEQLSHERIITEVNKSINTLKALENIVNDRMIGYNSLHSSLMKTHSSYEQLEHSDGTLKVALDSLYIFTEQELAQCKQHVFLGDLRKSLNEMRSDALRRINDYQKEINTAEKEVTIAEKRLAKTKEALERSMDYKSKMESFELDVILNTSRPVLNTSSNTSTRSSRDNTTTGGGITTSTGSMNSLTGTEDSVTRIERELRDDIRLLLRTIEQRDNLFAASRRAFQKLHRDCKNVAHISILKMSEKEQEYAHERRLVLDKLSLSVKNVNIEGDEREFIETHSGRDGALVLTSQALSLLNDLVPPALPETMDVGSHGGMRAGMYTYAENGVDARTVRDPRDRPVSPQVRRSDSLQGRSPPASPPPPSHSSRTKPSTSTPTSITPTSAASGTPSSSRFSFRRTLGLISEPKDPPPLPAPVPALPTAATAIPSTSSSVAHAAHMPTSVVVAAGRVGGGEPITSSNNNSSSSSSSIVPSATKAEFTEFLTQIFYPPALTTTATTTTAKTGNMQLLTGEQNRNTSTINPPNTTTTPTPNATTTNNTNKQSIDIPAISTVSSSEDATATTPKILIDDNYFEDPELQSTDSNNSTKHEEKISFIKKPVPDVLIRKDGNSMETTERKSKNRSMTVRKSELHCGALDWLRSNPAPYLITAVEGISRVIKTQPGRDAFTTELNQFRSRKVELGEEGFDALAMVLWTALSHCQTENDVHNASVIMMLSQTFYKRKSQYQPVPSETTPCSPLTPSDTSEAAVASEEGEDQEAADDDEDEEEASARGVEHRKYIKDLLIPHPIWKDGNFWEQTLWQCAIEQLQTIPYDRAWHDMSKDLRRQAVRRVHEVIFSQVMAVTHSMMEMGCSAEQSREFLYRMCVIHQLSEDMRHSLLKHVAAASLVNARRHSRGNMLGAVGGGRTERRSTTDASANGGSGTTGTASTTMVADTIGTTSPKASISGTPSPVRTLPSPPAQEKQPQNVGDLTTTTNNESATSATTAADVDAPSFVSV